MPRMPLNESASYSMHQESEMADVVEFKDGVLVHSGLNTPNGIYFYSGYLRMANNNCDRMRARAEALEDRYLEAAEAARDAVTAELKKLDSTHAAAAKAAYDAVTGVLDGLQ
jgi:hypothetical protein